jgi:hypothetical protein
MIHFRGVQSLQEKDHGVPNVQLYVLHSYAEPFFRIMNHDRRKFLLTPLKRQENRGVTLLQIGLEKTFRSMLIFLLVGLRNKISIQKQFPPGGFPWFQWDAYARIVCLTLFNCRRHRPVLDTLLCQPSRRMQGSGTSRGFYGVIRGRSTL